MVNFLTVRITDRRSSQVTDENAIREKRSDGHVDETKACESGKSIHQTNESVMPYPPMPLLSDVIRLLAFSMVALDRSTVLMALLAHRPAKERCRTRDRRTNGDGETKDPERKEPRQKNEGALFYQRRTDTENYGTGEGERKGYVEGGKDRGHHARGRGGVWSNLLRVGFS